MKMLVQLIQAAQLDDEESFEEIIKRFDPLLRKVSKKFVVNLKDVFRTLEKSRFFCIYVKELVKG